MAQQLGSLEEEEQITNSNRISPQAFGFQRTPDSKTFTGCLGWGQVSLVLLLFSFKLFAGLLVAILVQVSNIPRPQGLEHSKQEEIYQELTQLKSGLARLCHRCPWEWIFFQGNCYFFSSSQKNWHQSVIACQDVEAQLVVIKSAEEQTFLKLRIPKDDPRTWIGLSDLKHEGKWHWVDNSTLSSSFSKYWNDGEPNSHGDEDCAEFKGDGWNDSGCDRSNLWVCKRPSASCSGD